jgi:hypothetical protein
MKSQLNQGRRLSRRAGMTMVEVVTAAVISTMVLGTALSIFIAGAGSWLRGTEMIDAETQSKQAVRVISDQLRQAMVVTIDADGQGLAFRLPQRQANGIFTAPPVWDGVARRIFHRSGSIILQEGGAERVITRNVILTDPDNGNAAYRIFTPGTGGIVRDVTLRMVTRRTLANNVQFLGRKREVIYLRNIPRLTT